MLQILWVAPIGTVSSADTTSSSYTSVRALDEYGHSVQLKHAGEAAQRHGRLVVAGQSAANETVVVSFGQKPVVHLVSLTTCASFQQPKEVTNNNKMEANEFDTVALCCTGIKGDANWLIDRVQEHTTNVWNRYNHHMDSPAVAHLVSRLLGSFQGEDTDIEWQPGVRRDKSDWARPLGIQTLVLSQQSPILRIEPSGRVLTLTNSIRGSSNARRNMWGVSAIGKDSHIIVDKLRRMEQPEGRIGAADLQKRLVDLMIPEAPTDRRTYIMVEVLSRHGIRRTTIVVEKGKEVSRSSLT